MTDECNDYKLSARITKATKIADHLDAVEVTAEQMEAGNELTWMYAAQLADVHEPSEETRKLVLQMLRSRAAARAKIDMAQKIAAGAVLKSWVKDGCPLVSEYPTVPKKVKRSRAKGRAK